MPTTLAPIAEAEVEMYANRGIFQLNDSYDVEFCVASMRNCTGLGHKRFVPLALLFPIARRYWKSKPVAHRAKMRNIERH